MGKRIYVGNLPFTTNEDDLRELFGQFGEVMNVALINDRETGRPRGFGFVEMDENGAGQALETLDGTDFGGWSLRVNEAKERERGGRRPAPRH